MKEKSHSNIYQRAVHGGVWLVFTRIAVQIISFCRYIVLANMLDKVDFGMLGVAMMMIRILTMFTTTGFNLALIQKQEDIKDYLNTAWTFGILRAILLFILMYIGAPYMAMVKIPPERVQLTIEIIRAMGLTLVIGAFGNAGMIYLTKELDFRKLFVFNIMGTLIDVTVVVVIVSVYRTPWSLVFGRLASVAFNVVVTYLLHPYRPRIAFDLAKVCELWQFGKWKFGDSILEFLLSEGDDFFVWGYLGVSDLATYNLSYRFAHVPVTEITHVVSMVTFPAYSKLQDNIPRFRDAYIKVLEFTAFLTFPVALLIIAMTGDFVRLFLKPDWLGAIPVLQVLAFRAMICSIGATRGPVFLAMGQPRQMVRIKIVKLVMIIAVILPLTRMWGVVGTALTILIVDILIQPMAMSITHGMLKSNHLEMTRPLLFPALAALAMFVFVMAFRYWVWDERTYLCFFMTAALAGGVYLGFSYLFERLFGYKIRQILLEQIAAVRK